MYVPPPPPPPCPPTTPCVDLGVALTNRPQLQSQVALIPLIEPPCNDPALAAGCLGVFRVCGSDDLPAPLCPSVCDEYVIVASLLSSLAWR